MTLASNCKSGWNPHVDYKLSQYLKRLLSERDLCSHHHHEKFTRNSSRARYESVRRCELLREMV